MRRIFWSLVVLVFISGCYYDKYSELYPSIGNGCDTVGQVTYNNQVKPVFEAYCTSCHSVAGGKQGGYDFKLYSSAVSAAPKLIGAVKHLSGFSAMPNPNTKIDPCSISKIEKWVNAGTPQ